MAGKKVVKKKQKRNVPHGRCYIQAGFANTIVTMTDAAGGTVCWSSAGLLGFKGSRKGTPFAAQMAAEDAGKKAIEAGMKSVDVLVNGPGSGREPAVRAVAQAGLRVSSLKDVIKYYAEGALLANYQFLKYFTGENKKANSVIEIAVAENDISKSDFSELQIISEAVYVTRDLVNEPLSYLTAEQLSKEIESIRLIQAGVIDMTITASILTNWVDEAVFCELPFLLRDSIDLQKLVNSPISKYMEEQIHFGNSDIVQRLRLAKGYSVVEFSIETTSDLVGKTVSDSGLRERDIVILRIRRGSQQIPNPKGSRELMAGDSLLCYGNQGALKSYLPTLVRKKRKKRKLPPKTGID